MPTYEFRCEAGHSFDRFLKMSEAPLEMACAECGKPATRQMSGGAGLVFKGSGFYLTDYGRAGQKPSAGEAAVTSASDSKSGESKSSDSKSSDSKSSDSKSGDSKSSKTEAAPKTSASASKTDKSSSAKSSKTSE